PPASATLRPQPRPLQPPSPCHALVTSICTLHRAPSGSGAFALPLRPIEFHCPPPFPAASINDLHFVNLLARRNFPLQIFRPLFRRNPGGEPAHNVSTRTWIEGCVHRHVYLTGGFGMGNSIHSNIVDLQD